MRSRKHIPRKNIVQVYGKWKGIKVVWVLYGKDKHTVYYYRYREMWYPSSYLGLKKKGIIKEND